MTLKPTSQGDIRAGARAKSKAAAEAEEIRVGWKMAGIGMQVASEVAAGTLLGWLVDRWRGHGHVGVLIGSVVGICVGLYSLIRQTLKLNAMLDRTAPLAGRGRPLPKPDAEPMDGDAEDGADWQQVSDRAEQALQAMKDDDRLNELEWKDDNDGGTNDGQRNDNPDERDDDAADADQRSRP